MRRLCQLPVATLFLAALLAAPARAAEVDKLVPDDSEFISTVNVRQILDSALAKKYAAEPLRQLIKSNDEVQKVFDSLGLDPFKDFESVTSASPSGTDPDKGLLIVRGKFDVAKFKATAEEAAKDHKDILKIGKLGDHTIYEVQLEGSPQPMFVAIVDGGTILGSPSKDYLSDAFAKAAGKKQTMLKKEVSELVEKADAKQSMWLVALGAGLAKGPLANEPQAKAVLEKIKTITGGVTVADDLKVHFVIGTKDQAGAKEIHDLIEDGVTKAKGFLGFLGAQDKRFGIVTAFVESVKVKTEGSKVSLTGEATKDAIEKALNK